MKAKSKRKGNFPPLRFPEFKAEWKRKKLGEVMDFKVTNSYSREKLNYEKGTVKNIHYGDIHTKFRTLFNITNEIVPYINEEINIEKIAKDNYCQEGDVIFADASEDLNDVGKSIEIVKLNSEKLLSGLHTLLARPKRNIFFVGFNGYLFKSNFVRSQIQKEAQGIKVSSISAKRISNTELFYPTHQEQTKIASFLSLIDERIQTQMKIIEEWEKLKKGMIDELFSQKMSFINEKKIFICKTKSLSTLLIKNNEKNKKRKYSKVQSVSNKLGFANQEEIFANRRVASINISNYYVIRKGIFAYNPSRIDVGSLAYKVDDEISIISPLYVSFGTKKTYVVDLYLFYWFSSKYFITQMNSSFEGSVRNTLSYESLGRMKMVLPPIDKQQEIASILSSFDKKLSIERQILAQYQNQKKYLLQNMFI